MSRTLSIFAATLFMGCAHQLPTPSETSTPAATLHTPAQAPHTQPKLCSHFSVHFAFDSSELGQHERAALEKMAACLRDERGLTATITGHTDERGTEEYNLALGDRRAATVARYLVDLGAARSQLRSVSYGEQDPLCLDHDEACWSTNRRALVAPAEAVLNASR